MRASPPSVALCSTCGTSLTETGECVACLVRLGFDGAPDDDASAVFGDYEIARRADGSLWELGRGAMGVTYRGSDSVLDRPVALKVIEAPSVTAAGQTVRERFLREARAAAAFRHPNVAAVFQFGTSPASGRCYYAMELVEGETLEARVRRDGPLDVETALSVTVQVTRALVAAASHGLIHRDIKPGNIMLARPDSGSREPVVKVIDFGLAKAVVDGGDAVDLTHGGFLGTPAFASPEQFSGAPADARSDIYSLGVTLWYALTGEVPYGGKTIDEIRRGRTELALPLRKLSARRFPRPVIQLLRRTLAIDPLQRPASARDLMVELEECRARLGYTLPDDRSRVRSRRKLVAIGALVAVGFGTFFFYERDRHARTGAVVAPPKSIAVLPFQNMSEDKSNGYFADGVQDEILTTLAKVADLKVISRTSVMPFRDSAKRNLRHIAQELGVAHVLEGSVQRADNRVRVTAQLIDARTDTHIWADRYDGEVADVFAIQSEIAQKIAAQLKAALSPTEQAALVSAPTRDTAAYELYLRARELHRDGGAGGLMGDNALKEAALLEEAVARDPAFVPALCLLTQANLQAYSFTEDHTAARLEAARRPLEAAARLQPDSGEVHLARALFHFLGHRAYAPAMADLALAASALPNDATILYHIASIQRRQALWPESIKTMERALVLDPRNGGFALSLSHTFRRLRRYADARRVIDNVLAWKEDDLGFQFVQAEIDIQERGDLTRMRQILARDLPANSDRNLLAIYRYMLAYLERDHRTTAGAAIELGPWEKTHGFNTPREYLEGMAARSLGETERAADAFARARERAAAVVAARPDDAKALIVLARIDGKLGRKEDATRAAERAVELLPMSLDAYDGPLMLALLVQVYAEVGEVDRAIEVLQQAVAVPGGPSYGFLRLDAEYDGLRHDLRFDKIVASLAPDA
jgi:serine/threonine protein kinase/tetratricopeptide (TPR) repeat protein